VNSILLVGVGGQGILLASEVLCEILLQKGYDVKKNEIHGMAQRGGSVTSQIRYGEKVYSPKIPLKGADYILSLENIESARMVNHLAKDGKILANSYRIVPTSVSSGNFQYPEDIEDYLKLNNLDFRFIPAHKIAAELGNIKAMNIVMLGFLNQELKIDENIWFDIIKKKVKPKFVDLNIKAFTEGFNYQGEN